MGTGTWGATHSPRLPKAQQGRPLGALLGLAQLQSSSGPWDYGHEPVLVKGLLGPWTVSQDLWASVCLSMKRGQFLSEILSGLLGFGAEFPTQPLIAVVSG